MCIFRSTAVAMTTQQVNAAMPTGGHTPPSNNLFPCLVCYPGTNNYSLVWLPIDVNTATAATLNPHILNSLMTSSPQTTPPKPHPVSTISPPPPSFPPQHTTMETHPPPPQPHPPPPNIMNNATTATTTSAVPVATDATTPTLNGNPLLANNLSAAITQSYLQLLQLQQLQQQVHVQQIVGGKPDTDQSNPAPSLDLTLPPVSSLLPLTSMGGPSMDILTQAVSGSISTSIATPQSSNTPGTIVNKPLNLSALAATSATHSPQSSGNVFSVY